MQVLHVSMEAPSSVETLVNLSHLERITDDIGVIQFCQGMQPDVASGYTVDDNARALAVVALAYESVKPGNGGPDSAHPCSAGLEKATRLLDIYLRFLERAWTPEEVFHNWFGPGGCRQTGPHTEDAIGHAVWALGVVTACNVPTWARDRAIRLLKLCLPAIRNLRFVRARALCVAGLAAYLRGVGSDAETAGGLGGLSGLSGSHLSGLHLSGLHGYLPGKVRGDSTASPPSSPQSEVLDPSALRGLIRMLADDLVRMFQENTSVWSESSGSPCSAAAWRWFEDRLTYANGIMPYSLFLAYEVLGEPRYLETAVSSMDFLNSVCVDRGYVTLVGNRGWYVRGKARARFDQQPVDAMWLAVANMAAWKAVGSHRASLSQLPYILSSAPSPESNCSKQCYCSDLGDLPDPDGYARIAHMCREWFLGKNDAGLALYDPATGACHDGLSETSVNPNCGAESTIAGLITMMITDQARLSGNHPWY